MKYKGRTIAYRLIAAVVLLASFFHALPDMAEAADNGAELIVFPERALTGGETYNQKKNSAIEENSPIYDELIETSHGTVSSEYRVYISMIKYDDVKGGMCDGKFQVVGHAYETA